MASCKFHWSVERSCFSNCSCGVGEFNVGNSVCDNPSTKATCNALHGPSGNFRRNCLCILDEETTHPELIMSTN